MRDKIIKEISLMLSEVDKIHSKEPLRAYEIASRAYTLSEKNNLKKEMQNQVYQQPTVYIDLMNVKRITIEAATNLKDFIKELKITKDNVIINQPNQIVKTIFEMTGLEDITTIIEKKR